VCRRMGLLTRPQQRQTRGFDFFAGDGRVRRPILRKTRAVAADFGHPIASSQVRETLFGTAIDLQTEHASQVVFTAADSVEVDFWPDPAFRRCENPELFVSGSRLRGGCCVNSRPFQLGFVLALLAISVASAVGDEPRLEEPKLSEADAKFWDNPAIGPAAAAAQMVIARDPITIAAMRAKGLNNFVWRELAFAGDVVPPLDKNLLNDVQDGKFFPKVSDKLKKEVPRDVMATYQLFNRMLINSFETPLEAFKKSGEENKNVTYAHMMQAPNRYRGEVVRVQGRMTMLRQYDAPELARDDGVANMYEAWIFGPTPGANPFCVFFSTAPAGLEPAEKMDRKVTFYGYFLTNFKYDAGGGRRETPLLVGPTVIVNENLAADPIEPTTPYAFDVLLCVMGGLVVITIAVFLMNLWFRAGDDNVGKTIRGIQAKNRPVPFADEQQGIITPEDLTRSIPQAYPVPGHPGPGRDGAGRDGAGRDGLPRGSERPDPDPERN
jgi:hypothetical protein